MSSIIERVSEERLRSMRGCRPGEIQRLADQGALARLTAAYYALTYLGFAAPYLLALGARLTSYSILLTITAALALSTAAYATRRSSQPVGDARQAAG